MATTWGAAGGGGGLGGARAKDGGEGGRGGAWTIGLALDERAGCVAAGGTGGAGTGAPDTAETEGEFGVAGGPTR